MLKTTHAEEQTNTNSESSIFNSDRKIINLIPNKSFRYYKQLSWFILKSFNSSRKNVSFTLRFQIKIWGVTRFQSCNMVPWIFSHFPKMERYSGIEFSWIFDDMMRTEWCKCAERLVNYRQIKDKRNLLNVKIQFAKIRRIKRPFQLSMIYNQRTPPPLPYLKCKR